MNTVCLQVFVSGSSRHHGKLTYEWLLDTAREQGVDGGSAFGAWQGSAATVVTTQASLSWRASCRWWLNSSSMR